MKVLLKTFLTLTALWLCSFTIAQSSTIQVNGTSRSYILRLPANYDEYSLLPLQLFLHGGGFSIQQAEGAYGFTEHADTSGYILVYPQGLNNNWWPTNDLQFIEDLIDHLIDSYKVDTERIYASGHSAGGMMVNVLACQLPNKIAAFGDVGGFLRGDVQAYYNPTQAVPYVKTHGTGDNQIFYNGGGNIASADSLISFWRHHNNAQASGSMVLLPDINTTDNSHVEKYVYGQGRSEIVFYKVIGGGHDAPDWNGNNEMGYTNRDINTPAFLWDFFKRHKLNAIQVSYIGNAGFLIEGSNKKVLMDALGHDGYGVYAVPSSSLRDNIIDATSPFNAIDLHLITHNHGDHFSASLVGTQLENNPTMEVVATREVETNLQVNPNYSTYSNRITGITPAYEAYDEVTVSEIPITIIRMHHDIQDSENHAYIFELDGMKFLHIGDFTGDVTEDIEAFNFEDEAIDIAFINYGCYFDGEAKRDMMEEAIHAKHTILYHIANEDLDRVVDSCNNMANVSAFSYALESMYFYPPADTAASDTLSLTHIPVDNTIHVFPNPASQNIHISWPDKAANPINYTLWETGGRIVQQGIIQNNQLDITSMRKGIYFLQLNVPNKTIVEKVVIG